MKPLRTAICVVLLLGTTNAYAVTAEVAKKCNALLAKKFPPRVAGNPAAGSAQGTGPVQREYYKKCIESGGNVEDSDTKPPSDRTPPSDPKPPSNPKPK
ncbi:hypothetical protein [Bradyrhizobium sp. SYSU BS000235]|uniref:hypothetical protein n=1 Tax=Bradyrhizobium sp. SYSU BS000235 TaxID=3411332 RepID=UPI003C7964F0